MPIRVGLQYIAQWKESLEKAVQAYEQEPIVKGQIVFYGPSNFTRWSTKWGMIPLAEEVLGKSGAKCCINRGFGSSCAEHQLYYYPRMVRPLAPKVLVYAPFGNSMAFGYPAEETFELMQRVVAYTLTDFPECRIYLCAPGKLKKFFEGYDEAAAKFEALLTEFVDQTPNCFLIDAKTCSDLYSGDIFVEDGVHFNQEGYKRYAAFFREALKDELDQF